MGKPTICIGENKDADQLRGNREADHAFVFATRIVQFLVCLSPKFQASSSFLCLYRPVCVRPVWKPHCWFFHEAAPMIQIYAELGQVIDVRWQSSGLLCFLKLAILNQILNSACLHEILIHTITEKGIIFQS